MYKRKLSCLLVENNFDDQQVFLEAFRIVCAESECCTVVDGEQALCTLIDGSFQPDYIFTDIYLPGIDGFEFLSVIKEIENLKHIPVIILSNDYSEQQVKRAKSLGATAFYSKRLGMLSEILEKYLKRPASSSTIL